MNGTTRLCVIVAMLWATPLAARGSTPSAKSAGDTRSKPTSGGPQIALAGIKKIFVEPMPNDLDQYIRAEISKQFKGKVIIVLSKEDADAILTGTGSWQKGTGAAVTGRYLGLHDTSTGAVSLISKDEKSVLWSSEAGDRSLWLGALARGGPRKVAERLVHNLKKAMVSGD